MISLQAALAAYPARIQALSTELIRLEQALHRVLRADVLAACDLPRHSQSALDGYVFGIEAAARAPCRLRIAETIAAGDTGALRVLQTGECQRIFTGARVPPGAGAVVAQERVTVADSHMELREPLKPGANIRWQGEEARAGSVVAEAGQRITPGLIAALAAAGAAEVTVTRAPRIRVLVSGDELRPLGTELADGQIWDSNGPLVRGWLQSQGYAAEARHLGDSRTEVEQALQAALAECDLVITTGGISVGDKDYILPAAESLGVRRVFWQVAQKPGKPLYFGTRPSPGATRHPLPPAGEGVGERESVLIGLPGNPAAVLIGLTLHVRTVLDLLDGAKVIGAPFHHGVLYASVKADARRDSLLRMRQYIGADGRSMLRPLPHQDSHMMSNLNIANVLVHAPAREQAYAAGEILRWTPLA